MTATNMCSNFGSKFYSNPLNCNHGRVRGTLVISLKTSPSSYNRGEKTIQGKVHVQKFTILKGRIV